VISDDQYYGSYFQEQYFPKRYWPIRTGGGGGMDNCGGWFGTPTFGQAYFAQGIFCGQIPPLPPAPPSDEETHGGGGEKKRKKRYNLEDEVFRIRHKQRLVQEAIDRRLDAEEEEELAQIIVLWLNIKD